MMTEVLTEAGLFPIIGHEAQLLIVDVDSGVPEVNERIAFYEDQEKPILVCGLRHSREMAETHCFIERPFSLGTLVAECFSLLGIEREDSQLIPPSLFSDNETPVANIIIDDTDDDLEFSGSFVSVDPDATANMDLKFEDSSSMIMEVEALNSISGAAVRGGVEKRRVENAEIQSLRVARTERSDPRLATINQTMPDTPFALAEQSETGEMITAGLSEASNLFSTMDGELDLKIRGVAGMLAQSWQRIALTARTEDRCDRIERVLLAALNRSLRDASAEVQRIPLSSGFAGGLEVLSLIDVLRTVRDRRLRGKLEIATGERAYVLHVDGPFLDAIELLSGDTDLIMLNILRQGGAIDQNVFESLKIRYDNDRDEFEPLEMHLLSQKVVSATTLKSAREVRSREVFKSMCGLRGGQFAFLEVRLGDGQSWPRDPLRISHDEILLEMLRESSLDTGDSQATARTRLVVDSNRAASFPSHQLTELERSVLSFFRRGETLADARERLEKLGDPDAVDEVVNRLKKLELLRRSTLDPAGIPIALPIGRSDTVVSKIPEGISEKEKAIGAGEGTRQISEGLVDDEDEDVTVNRHKKPTDK